jgi:protein-tyrosine phosphatase
MPDVVDWQRADPREALSLALRLLAGGDLVAFPTEAGYAVAASALDPDAVARLHEVAGKDEPGHLAVAVGGPGEALDWLPALGLPGRRLARRCWPGPMALVCGTQVEQGLASRLPEPVRARALAGGGLTVRSPAHEAVLHVMRSLPRPLLLAGAGNGQPAVTAAEAARVLGDRARLVLDDGPSHYSLPPTVVRVEGDSWDVLHEGVLTRAVLQRLLPCRIVFVCTGNTCRSPLAEALCKKLLAERLGCPVARLPEGGFLVQSAGLAAMIGGEAAPEAVDTARELGADLADHRSQPLTRELLAQADHVIAMTRGHLRALSGQGGPAPRLLSAEDIPDPIGAPPEVYRECARQILGALEKLLPELR